MDTVPSSISVTRLLQSHGTARAPFLVDVRRLQAFESDDFMIAGATWRDPFAVTEWLRFLPHHRAIAVYCVHGHEISKNACAALLAAGLKAHYVAGGIEAWKEIGAPTIRKQPALAIPSPINAPSKWITRERPKIDRIACPWLIRRFIDPCAEFIYVPAAKVREAATASGAIPFDVPEVQFSHRGDQCSFDAFLADFELRYPALSELAVIVRGADTGKPELTPESGGLLAVSLGLSALFEDDQVMLNHGLVIYDALYAWLRSARAEVHNADLFKKS